MGHNLPYIHPRDLEEQDNGGLVDVSHVFDHMLSDFIPNRIMELLPDLLCAEAAHLGRVRAVDEYLPIREEIIDHGEFFDLELVLLNEIEAAVFSDAPLVYADRVWRSARALRSPDEVSSRMPEVEEAYCELAECYRRITGGTLPLELDDYWHIFNRFINSCQQLDKEEL